MFADRMPPPGGQCRNQIMQSRSMNISIIIQPPLFSLDSGRQFLHTRQFCLLPTNLRLNDKVLKMKYAEAGFYMNKKLAKAQLAAENGNQEVSRIDFQ